MNNSLYFNQSVLLLKILQIVNNQNIFALKGGTAINFFVRDLPRLSVDIDLVYLPLSDRTTSLQDISRSLVHIEANILKLIHGTQSQRKLLDIYTIGLIIHAQNATVKIEPNLTIRGTVYPPTEYDLCKKGKDLFELSLKTRSLVKEELYAGKICAALDRQHPRDIYDIKLLFENEGITDKTRKAFIVYLISHNRPINELLNPNFLDITKIYEQEFIGMVNENVELSELISTRETLVKEINGTLSDSEKQFLLTFKSINPVWELLELPNIQNLPAVKWKLLNLKKMEHKKHSEALSKLERVLNNI
ncbi:MAG: nucleotidyl transferase AbiEii/AbiGii toxin family protein [bacterium]